VEAIMSARSWRLLAILAIVVLVVIREWFPGPTGITATSHARIRPGMSQAEVEAIIGLPPGLYFTRPWILWDGPGRFVIDEGHRREWWWNSFGLLEVGFDASGRVVSAEYQRYKRDRPILAEWFLPFGW
jgi:hypothetical protein